MFFLAKHFNCNTSVLIAMANQLATKTLDDKEDVFGKDFFDSGQHAPGTFDSYSFDEYCLSFKPLSEIIKKHFNPKRVLDVGCAKGSFVYAFRALGIEAFGVDVSEYAISCAPKILQPFLSAVDLDKERLPYNDNSFDFITFFGSIEYLRNHRRAIAEIERVMVNGGSLLLTTIYKRPKGDVYRINAHNKAFWIKEFNGRWNVPTVYYGFMSDYFRRPTISSSNLSKLKGFIFGKSRFSDKLFVHLWDFSAALHILDYGVILLTLKKS